MRPGAHASFTSQKIVDFIVVGRATGGFAPTFSPGVNIKLGFDSPCSPEMNIESFAAHDAHEIRKAALIG